MGIGGPRSCLHVPPARTFLPIENVLPDPEVTPCSRIRLSSGDISQRYTARKWHKVGQNIPPPTQQHETRTLKLNLRAAEERAKHSSSEAQ